MTATVDASLGTILLPVKEKYAGVTPLLKKAWIEARRTEKLPTRQLPDIHDKVVGLIAS